MFVDEVIVKLYAGAGGDGCTSFRREKCEPMGGPDGGNGGKGSSIIFVGDRNLKTLVDLRYHKIIKASKGINGKGSNKYGANSEDIKINVPLGTTVIDEDTNLVIADIIEDKQEAIIAKGGRGGSGNRAFATNSDPAPGFGGNPPHDGASGQSRQRVPHESRQQLPGSSGDPEQRPDRHAGGNRPGGARFEPPASGILAGAVSRCKRGVGRV